MAVPTQFKNKMRIRVKRFRRFTGYVVRYDCSYDIERTKRVTFYFTMFLYVFSPLNKKIVSRSNRRHAEIEHTDEHTRFKNTIFFCIPNTYSNTSVEFYSEYFFLKCI